MASRHTDVVCLKDYVYVIPATELVSEVNGVRTKICDIPEKTITYSAGEVLTFSSKKNAKLFLEHHPVNIFALK